MYPPGQFSPWNAPELRAISAAGRSGLTAGSGPEISEPGYPLLAVSDPSADATATQTWAVLDDAQLAGLDGAQLAGEWTTPRQGPRPVPGGTRAGAPGTAKAPRPGHGDSSSRPTDPRHRPDLRLRDYGARHSRDQDSRAGTHGTGLAGTGRTGAPSGYAGQPGYGHPASTGYPGEAGFPGETGFPGRRVFRRH